MTDVVDNEVLVVSTDTDLTDEVPGKLVTGTIVDCKGIHVGFNDGSWVGERIRLLGRLIIETLP